LEQLPNIEKLLCYLERKGRAKNTLIEYEKNLKYLAQRADLRDIPAVEKAIARYTKKNGQPATNNYKSKLCDNYALFVKKILDIADWEKPIYTPEDKGIQPPSDERVTAFISSARYELSMKIEIMARTGYRPCEIVGEKGITVRDIHPDTCTITARIHKGCNSRPAQKVTPELIARLMEYIQKKGLKSDDILFRGRIEGFGESFRKFRNKLAEKLKDPTINNVRLYDLRHYYCTKQLKRTQNCEIVRQIMGHKKLDTTQKYLHLLAGTSGEWIVEGTTDKKRAQELLANDFTYQLTTPDGTMLFRKPK
jgi:integrase